MKWLTSQETLTFEIADGVARITLNRPEKRNAISGTMLRELRQALLEADDRKSVHCVVLSGNGKDFCAGYDIGAGSSYEKELEIEAGDKPREAEYRGHETFDDDAWGLERMNDAKMTLFDMHKPVIARVHGNCLAGGTDLAFLSDMVIAANDARIGFPATRAQGSPPNNMWLAHAGPQWAKRLVLTGDIIRGRDAARIGLVMQSVPIERLDAVVDDLARRLASIDPEILSANKRVINLGMELLHARTMQRIASEMDTRAHQAPARAAWRKDVHDLGLKGALKKRDAPFGDGEIHLDPA